MRYTILILLLCFYTVVAQDKIDGIGRFKIMKTTIKDLNDVAQEFGLRDSIPVYHSPSEYKNMLFDQGLGNSVKILELKVDTTKENNSVFAVDCPSFRVFYFEAIKISDFYIKDIYLVFYEEKLIRISSKFDYNLFNALKIKYGEPEIVNETKPITCVYKLTGVKETKMEGSIYRIWKNGNIKAENKVTQWYNSDCKESGFSTFSISIKPLDELFEKCYRYNLNLRNERDKIREKQKLKDF